MTLYIALIWSELLVNREHGRSIIKMKQITGKRESITCQWGSVSMYDIDSNLITLSSPVRVVLLLFLDLLFKGGLNRSITNGRDSWFPAWIIDNHFYQSRLMAEMTIGRESYQPINVARKTMEYLATLPCISFFSRAN